MRKGSKEKAARVESRRGAVNRGGVKRRKAAGSPRQHQLYVAGVLINCWVIAAPAIGVTIQRTAE